ncbi:type 4a pilus biogenesis protein PilO [Jatrophihabitans sp. YIM 134969]
MRALNSPRLVAAIVTVAALLMGGAAYLLAIAPARADKASVQSQIDDASLTQATLRRKLATLEDASKQTGALRAANAAATAALPAVADTQGLLRQVQAAATAHGVTVGAVTIAPPAETDVEGVWGLPVTIDLGGSPDGLLGVVQTLQTTSPRALTMSGVTLSTLTDGVETLSLAVTVFSTSAPLVQDGRVVGGGAGSTPAAGAAPAAATPSGGSTTTAS